MTKHTTINDYMTSTPAHILNDKAIVCINSHLHLFTHNAPQYRSWIKTFDFNDTTKLIVRLTTYRLLLMHCMSLFHQDEETEQVFIPRQIILMDGFGLVEHYDEISMLCFTLSVHAVNVCFTAEGGYSG